MADVTELVQGDVRVRIEGLNKTLRALSKAGADAADMKGLMHELGMMVIRSATPPVIEGTLKATMRAGRGKTKAVVRAGGAKAAYAGVIHYGWPARNIAPNPFLKAALTRQRGAVLERLNKGIDDIIRKNDLK